MRQRTDFSDQEDNDLWNEDTDFWASQIEPLDAAQISPSQLASEARTLRDLESLVKVLDTMETVASLAELSRECVSSLCCANAFRY